MFNVCFNHLHATCPKKITQAQKDGSKSETTSYYFFHQSFILSGPTSILSALFSKQLAPTTSHF